MASKRRREYEAVIALGGKMSPSLARTIKQMTKDLGDVNKKVETQNKSFNKLNKTMGRVAKTALTVFGGKLVLDQFNKTVQAAGDLQTGMSNVATLVDGDVNQVMLKYKDVVDEVQLATGKMTDVTTNGLFEVISAYGETSDTVDQFRLSMKAATAGNADVADTVKLLSAVTKGYGDTSVEAQKKAADLAFKTVELGQTTFPELAASMGKVISLAQPLKISQEELFAGFATLTGVTGDTAAASTQLAAINKAFLSPTEDMQKVIEKMGFSTGAAAVQAMGYQKVLALMREEVDGNAVAFSNLFGRAEAKTAALALTGAQADTFVKKLEEMEKAGGAMESAFNKRSESFDVISERAKRLQEVLRRQIGLKALPMVNKGMLFLINNSDKLSKVTGKVFEAMGSLKAPIKWLFDVGVSIYNTLKDSITRNKETVDKLIAAAIDVGTALYDAFLAAQPVVEWLISNGLGTLLDVVFELIDAILTVYNIFVDNWSLIGPIVGGVTASIIAYKVAVNLAWIQTAIGVTWLNIWSVAAGVATGVTTAFGAAIAFLTSPIGIIVIAIGALVAAVLFMWKNWDKVSKAMATAWKVLKIAIMAIIGAIAGAFKALVGGIVKGAKAIGGFFKKIFGGKKKTVSMEANVKTNEVAGTVPAFAKGVKNFSGGPAIVGDGGPELLNLPRGTDVTSVSKTADLIGSARSRVTDLVERVKATNVTKVFKIVYAPEIHANDVAGVEQALTDSYEQFVQYMNRFKNENEDTNLSFEGV